MQRETEKERETERKRERQRETERERERQAENTERDRQRGTFTRKGESESLYDLEKHKKVEERMIKRVKKTKENRT